MPEISAEPSGQPEKNPWYLLATVYGDPITDELRARNRMAWNRFMAPRIGEDTKARLIERKTHSAEELKEFSTEEWNDLKIVFNKRSCSAVNLEELLDKPSIYFGHVNFPDHFYADYLIFPVNADFTSANFGHQAHFRCATFSGVANFSNVTFSAAADFEETSFTVALFGDARFSYDALFRGASFSSTARFDSVKFHRGGNFSGVKFATARFEHAEFLQPADFKRAEFAGNAEFDATTFHGWIRFESVIFGDKANFAGAVFKDAAQFVNAEMKNVTSFQSAKFKREPPEFFNAKLHEGTFWDRVEWPKCPDDIRWRNPDINVDFQYVDRFIYAYERLKAEMDRLKKHEDELDFFAREMECRRIQLGTWSYISLMIPTPVWIKPRAIQVFGHRLTLPSLTVPVQSINLKPRSIQLFGHRFTLPSLTVPIQSIKLKWPTLGLAIAVYGSLSDYGRSYMRPLSVLLAMSVLGALPLWAHFGDTGRALGLSFATTFAVFGLRKDLFASQLIEGLPGWLNVIAALQATLGIMLLFLLGLALRNHFRMK